MLGLSIFVFVVEYEFNMINLSNLEENFCSYLNFQKSKNGNDLYKWVTAAECRKNSRGDSLVSSSFGNRKCFSPVLDSNPRTHIFEPLYLEGLLA